MFICIDVYYPDNGARAAGVLFRNIESQTVERHYSACMKHVEDYTPGQFYKRELPVILQLLDKVEENIQTIIIDGHVWLSGEEEPGLGAKLYTALGKEIPVIGVAKRPYRKPSAPVKIYRGTTVRPLYITSAGMDDKKAAELIGKMHGPHRLPTLLQYVDRLSRRA